MIPAIILNYYHWPPTCLLLPTRGRRPFIPIFTSYSLYLVSFSQLCFCWSRDYYGGEKKTFFFWFKFAPLRRYLTYIYYCNFRTILSIFIPLFSFPLKCRYCSIENRSSCKIDDIISKRFQSLTTFGNQGRGKMSLTAYNNNNNTMQVVKSHFEKRQLISIYTKQHCIFFSLALTMIAIVIDHMTSSEAIHL